MKNKWREENRDRVRANERAWYTKNREKSKKKCRDYRARLRTAVFAMYGNKCVCGESDLVVLTLDHIQGGGTQHRKNRGGQGVYSDALATNDPTKYRILCANCQIRAYHGLI